MLRNHFKIAFRLFAKHKVYTGINLLGLSLALMICFFSYLYIQDEQSYDNFHTDADRVFLINKIRYTKDVENVEPGLFDTEPIEGISKSSANSLPFLKLAETTIPEIESLVKIQAGYITIKTGEEESSELTQYVDEGFFEVVDYHFIYGNSADALSDLKSAVVSDKFAMKYFGKLNAIGEQVNIKGEAIEGFLVTGVISTSQNSIINRNIFLRVENSPYLKNSRYDSWSFSAFSAFIKLNDPNNQALVAGKLRDIEVDHDGLDQLKEQREMLNLGPENPVYSYQLKSLSGIYLDPTLTFFGESSSMLYSLILAGISLIILIIACINYLAISITSSAGRRSEMAIRKVIGANVFHLKTQFYAESLLQVLIAVLLGFTLTQAFLPLFDELANKQFNLSLIENLRLLVFGLAFGVALTFFAGGYPAQILSRFKVLSGLKGNTSHKIKSKLIQGMVVFQFAICLTFISAGLVMRKQFEFINNKQLGFDKEHVVYVQGVSGKTELLKEELSMYPSVVAAAGSDGVFVGRMLNATDVVNGVENRISFITIDSDFFKTMGIELVDVPGILAIEHDQLASGMSFINQSYYEILKEDTVKLNAHINRTKGVIRDFHFESLQNEITPQMFEIDDSSSLSTLFVRLSPNQITEGIEAIKDSYAKITEKSLKEVKFLDEFLESKYEDSQKWQKIVNVSASIGILIASIGLFGLTGIGMANQMKELSIRKVLGAGSKEIAYTLNKQSLILIVIASVISIPLSYSLIRSWLDGFAYHVDISADLFALSLLLLIVITAITVAYHSLKVIFTNPVNILRNE
ncbi:MAG: ABC transporter permease [Cytophagia bacterium]|nr:ABC transporter permease [Cytophagia bacterium]